MPSRGPSKHRGSSQISAHFKPGTAADTSQSATGNWLWRPRAATGNTVPVHQELSGQPVQLHGQHGAGVRHLGGEQAQPGISAPVTLPAHVRIPHLRVAQSPWSSAEEESAIYCCAVNLPLSVNSSCPMLSPVSVTCIRHAEATASDG